MTLYRQQLQVGRFTETAYMVSKAAAFNNLKARILRGSNKKDAKLQARLQPQSKKPLTYDECVVSSHL